MAKRIGYIERLSISALYETGDGVLFYNHIPKCGGLSLASMLRRLFPHACDVHQNIFDPRFTPLNCQLYHGHGVSGVEHWLASEKSYYYITFLRHPWSLAQSLLRFFSWLLPLDAYYTKAPEQLLLLQQPNILIEYLGNGDAILAEENLLQNYAFFGLQEQFTASIQLLGEILPPIQDMAVVARNVSRKEQWSIPEDVKSAFFEKNAADIALYEKAQEEFLRRVANYSAQKNTENTTNTQAPLPNALVSHHEADHMQTVLNLKESIALNEDLPGMDVPDARFENWLFILLHSMQSNEDYILYLQWLMQRISRRVSCLYFAYHVAVKGQLPQLAQLAQLLFTLCQERDKHNKCRILVDCRQHIVELCVSHKLFSPTHSFMHTLLNWQQTLLKNSQI